ncbi:MAG: HEPN domain-containing protein [Thermoprotei archaeon]
MYVKWIERAKRYYELAHRMFDLEYYPETCFYAQQCIEFLLKGLMIKYVGARPYTHDLLLIFNGLKEHLRINIGEEKLYCLKYLTEQYIGSRYPDARISDYGLDDARKCIECLEELWRVFKSKENI